MHMSFYVSLAEINFIGRFKKLYSYLIIYIFKGLFAPMNTMILFSYICTYERDGNDK